LAQDKRSDVNFSDPLDVQKAAEAFIEAFNNLDWERFRHSFSADATVFFPFQDVPRRVNGKDEIEAVFKSFFDDVRKRKPTPPHLNIEPKEIKTQILGDSAVVTFHYLRDDDSLGRRTVIFQKQKGIWLIVHLHASNLVTPKRG
jgi:ketosteroid isomerase-like protein